MEAENKRSKGGFLQFFDWNGKSKKKLVTNNPDLQGSKQGKGFVESMAKSQVHVAEVDDRRAKSNYKVSSEFGCASSVASDEGYGTRAPGVVARLMGLDCLPTFKVLEQSSTPSFDSHSLRASKYDLSNHNLQSECNSMDYLNILNRQEQASWSSVEPKLHNLQNRSIERFQTEVLPPKSAKRIPITHYKLLSPIKSPGFIPTRNVASMVEASAKMIEASPKATNNPKVPSIMSSSVPLGVRDLYQRMEAAHATAKPQRLNASSAAKIRRGQPSDRSQSGSEGISSRKASTFPQKGITGNLKNKGKAVSVAVQPKGTFQRREKSSLRSKNITRQKEEKEVKSNQLLRSPPGMQKTAQKRSSERTGNVLRQNNQKQNSALDKDSSTSKNPVRYDHQGRQAQTTTGSVEPSSTSNKCVKPVSGKTGLAVVDSGKEKTKNISQKKQLLNGDPQNHGSLSDNVSLNKDKRSIKFNAIDGFLSMAADNRKNGMDVLSFTFSSPIKGTMPGQLVGKSNSFVSDSFGSRSSPSCPGFNVIGSNVLGVLLEDKLHELTSKDGSSGYNVIRDETPASSTYSLQNSMPALDVASTSTTMQRRAFQVALDKDRSDHLDDSDCFSVESLQLTVEHHQQFKEMEEQSSSSNFSEFGKELECQHPSPVSILEPSLTSRSCTNINGSKHYSLAEAPDMFHGSPKSHFLEVDGETELSDSASSISVVDIGMKPQNKRLIMVELKVSSDWELDYLRGILDNSELVLEDFAVGQVQKIIPLNPFDHLENQENRLERDEDEYIKLGRKVFFDCVNEWLEFICSQSFVGSYKAWARLWTLFERKGWLAEELHKEILVWKSMGDLMVDELVDKDMSTQYGRWVDFSKEAFEEGVEIEKEILTSLVDELVCDAVI